MSIRDTQNTLVKLGYGAMLGKYGVDGKDGTMTRGAVSAAQKDYNRIYKKSIKVDGIAGRVTKPALNQMLKDAGTKGTRNFKISEFRCKGSGQLPKGGMDSKLITKLEELRYALGNKPTIINSGYRSKSHNAAVGGAKNSQHLYGKAADIKVRGVTPTTVYNAADKLFNGVGKYPTFTHVDTRSGRARF